MSISSHRLGRMPVYLKFDSKCLLHVAQALRYRQSHDPVRRSWMRLGISVPSRLAGRLQLHGPHHRCGRGMDVKLAVGILDVASDGVERHAELVSDLRIA